ncbi:MAG: AmmeMemoRadiSam system radical SAM enzyme [Nanoarchaeota archaeon]|nr:AmmeMemoRadiSam system radical SAM enzyme [Nanoarchaeota archaeon]
MAKKKEKRVENLLFKRITRRQFIGYGAAGLAALSAGGYLLNKALKKPGSSIFPGEAPSELWKWSKEGYHYRKLGENVQCEVCPNSCLLEPGDRSICRNKINHEGKLYTLAYGNPCAVHIDPIEKKPLFHFLPQSLAFSIATAGCTFRCLNCQNWSISQSKPEETRNYDLMPGKVIEAAMQNKCSSIAYTYSEPTAFYEYMYDSSKLAQGRGIKNIWITNGSMNEEALRDLCKYMDAANVDLKGFKEDIYNELNAGQLKPILHTLKVLKEEKKWFEITNLVVPSWTDDLGMIREMCSWLDKEGFSDYPLHFSRFTPLYKLTHLPPTPVKTLENARKIAQDEGIKFVYIGNVPGTEAQNTYCPRCSKLLIERQGYLIKQNHIKDGTCEFCGEKIPGVWTL